MRIAYVIHRFPWPSETFISREVASVIGLGYDVDIYAFERPGPEHIKRLTPETVALMERTRYIGRSEALAALLSPVCLAMLPAERNLAKTASSNSSRLMLLGRSAAFARRLAKDGVDGIHAHWPYATQAAHLASVQTGIPYSVSIHAHEVAHDNGHFANCFPRLRFAAFCNAAAMNYLLSTLDSSAARKSHLIYHGVDIDSFEWQPPLDSVAPVRILSAGRLTKTKGFDRLVRACAEAARRGMNVQLTILGHGSEEGAIRTAAEQCGFSDRLSLPGWVPHTEVPHYFRDSHLFALLASDDFNDGLPNVVVEAMASGRPVILSPVPAAREIIEHGRNGFILSAPDDQEGLISAINQLSIEGGAARMGQAARETVVAKYDARKHILTMTALFDEVFK